MIGSNSGSEGKLHDNFIHVVNPKSLWPFTSGWKLGDPGKFLLTIENSGIGHTVQLHQPTGVFLQPAIFSC